MRRVVHPTHACESHRKFQKHFEWKCLGWMRCVRQLELVEPFPVNWCTSLDAGTGLMLAGWHGKVGLGRQGQSEKVDDHMGLFMVRLHQIANCSLQLPYEIYLLFVSKRPKVHKSLTQY